MIAAGFDQNTNAAKLLDKDYTVDGILILSDADKHNTKVSMDSKMSSIKKFQDISTYQFQFGYNPAIRSELNVPQGPGFESLLGIFGGGD